MTLPCATGSPCLMLDLEAFERNVAQLAQTIVVQGKKRWRPHVKAIRSPHLAQRLIAAGASGVTCSSVAEAETMVGAGIDDVLISSQVIGPDHLRRLALLNRSANVISAIDALAHIALLAAAAGDADVVLPVVIEVDIGLGRAGVAPGPPAALLAREVLANRRLRFCGLMAWEGQTTQIQDPVAKEAAIRASVGLLTDTARQCNAAGIGVEIVSCGGTGTYPVTSTIDGVTEIQAGGGVFGDVRYRTEFNMSLTQALTLNATVISRPASRRIVCDAGWKSHGFHPTPSRPLGLAGAFRMRYGAQHLTLDCDQEQPDFAVGSRIALEVGYADSTVFLHRELWAVRHGEVEEILPLPAHCEAGGAVLY